LAFDISTPHALPSGTVSFQIVDWLLQPVVHLMFFGTDNAFCREAGTYRLTCEIPHLRLYLGRYAVTAHLSEAYGTWVHYQTVEAVCPFEVVMHGHDREWPWQEGACRYVEDGHWELTCVPRSTADLVSVLN
jgi:lipopolysaccharide transport system ATP-binding protein